MYSLRVAEYYFDIEYFFWILKSLCLEYHHRMLCHGWASWIEVKLKTELRLVKSNLPFSLLFRGLWACSGTLWE